MTGRRVRVAFVKWTFRTNQHDGQTIDNADPGTSRERGFPRFIPRSYEDHRSGKIVANDSLRMHTSEGPERIEMRRVVKPDGLAP